MENLREIYAEHSTFVNAIVAVSMIVAFMVFVLEYSWNPFAHIANTKDNMEAAVEASKARQIIQSKRDAGEKGIIQVSGCVQKPDNWKMAHHSKIPGTIFVSVASYRDDECKDTVYEMFAKAKDPDNLYVGVCQQNKENEEDCFDKCPECSQRKQSGHIRVANFDFMDARGPTFARYQCSKLWRGEELYFQIDSHIKFEQDWDDTLRKQWSATGDPKAVIGAYPPTKQQMKDMKQNGFSTMITMCPGKFDANGLPTITAKVVNTKGRQKPLPIAFQPAGMMCFPGQALNQVPYDPYLSYLFFGEEVLFSARLWTAGYNLYSPAKNFCVHHYGRKNKPKYWQDHKESEPCRKKAVQRVKYLLGIIKPSQVHPDYFLKIKDYGMGKKRSLADYFKYAGINMNTKTVNTSCPAP